MSTIREIVAAHAQGPIDPLVEALVAREESKIEALLATGVTQFAVEPIFAVKVLMDLELGAPKTQEMQAYVNEQFAAKVREYQQRYAEQAGDVPPEENNDSGDEPQEGQS